MAGSILKIWPWKEVLETRIIRGKVHAMVERNILPPAIDGEVVFAIVLAIIGFLAVLVIEGLSRKNT
jgi:putative membrane protein